MREIKFRAWHKELKKMFYNCTVNSFGTWQCESTHFGGENDTLMQFTGLKDKNGKEIYEGDIITFYSDSLNGQKTFVVGWKGLGFGFMPFGNVWDFGHYCEDYEIIGNIYQNPELLKEVAGGD
jgi:hypothetical protein